MCRETQGLSCEHLAEGTNLEAAGKSTTWQVALARVGRTWGTLWSVVRTFQPFTMIPDFETDSHDTTAWDAFTNMACQTTANWRESSLLAQWVRESLRS
jgi:hypothetical protein